MLLTFPLFDDAALEQLQLLLAGAAWGDGRVSAGEQAARVKNNEQLPPGDPAAATARKIVLDALERSPAFLSAALPKKIFPPHFNRYGGASNHYGQHVDGAVRFTEAGVRIRTDLSCTVFLSDPCSYQGGELVVHEGAGSRQVKLPAGQAVLYPGNSVHEVLPVTSGQRLAAFFWVESLVRSNEQRALLLDFDNALMALRREAGDSASTVALTGTYHNLLRLWADT
jgi:PKHD-type hydroxylase